MENHFKNLKEIKFKWVKYGTLYSTHKHIATIWYAYYNYLGEITERRELINFFITKDDRDTFIREQNQLIKRDGNLEYHKLYDTIQALVK